MIGSFSIAARRITQRCLAAYFVVIGATLSAPSAGNDTMLLGDRRVVCPCLRGGNLAACSENRQFAMRTVTLCQKRDIVFGRNRRASHLNRGATVFNSQECEPLEMVPV